jgi:hypothetical protein
LIDSDSIIRHAEDFLRRVSPEGRARAQRARERRRKAFLRIAKRLAILTAGIFLAAIVAGLVLGPIGDDGVLVTALALIVGWAAVLFFSRTPEATPEALVQADLALLPSKTEEWLERQRPALPAPAARLVDGIAVRLDALGPQLQGLDPREPAAAEVRRLIGEDLPELVKGYQRVPTSLRREVRDGTSPDSQLIDGLKLVDSELLRMTELLAAGDLDALATRGKYLELKYKGEDGI